MLVKRIFYFLENKILLEDSLIVPNKYRYFFMFHPRFDYQNYSTCWEFTTALLLHITLNLLFLLRQLVFSPYNCLIDDSLRVLPLFALFFLYSTLISGQNFNLGNPPIENFNNKEYGAATQNWKIDQDERGIIYVANNSGMLQFDGFNWKLYPIGNGTIVRSVSVGEENQIFVGGQGDFGFFHPNERGKLVYHSLLDIVDPTERGFGDVWEIIKQPEGIFFRTDRYIFLFANNKITSFPTEEKVQFMGILKGTIFYQIQNGELRFFNNNAFQSRSDVAKVNGIINSALAFHPDTTLLVTIESGIYAVTSDGISPWVTKEETLLKEGRLYCATILSNGMLALGSTNNGLYILDRNRVIYHHLRKKEGLQNSIILAAFNDRNGDLWLGLDRGIDLVKTSSPFTTIFPDGNLEGTGYAAVIFEDALFFGTNTGLYTIPLREHYSPEEKKAFQLIPNSEGQIWSLQVLEDELLIGSHEGGFAYKNGQLRKLTPFGGVWRFISREEGQAIAGHYEGVALIKKINNEWTFLKKYEGLFESSRLLAPAPNGEIWMAHPYRGLYHLNFDDKDQLFVKRYGAKQGLPADVGHQVFALRGKAVIAANKGIYYFKAEENKFLPVTGLSEKLGQNKRTNYLTQDKSGNVWFVQNDQPGVLLISDEGFNRSIRQIDFPELAGRPMNGFEYIFPMDKDDIILATEKGYEHFSLTNYDQDSLPFEVIISELVVEFEGDSLLLGSHHQPGPDDLEIELKHDQNNLRLQFGATDHHGKDLVRFAHRIKENQEWSEWSRDNRLLFNGLSHGEYQFEVKAINQHGQETEVVRIPVRITPPWYASTMAKIIYWILLCAALLFYGFRQQKNFETEKAQMAIKHQQIQSEQELKVSQSEAKISELEREKLAATVQFKTHELASTTLNLVQKSEFLSSIRSALEKLKKNEKLDAPSRKEIGQIIRRIENDVSLQSDWEQFSGHFDQVHHDFLKRLADQYPHLSPNDFKLSAYLKMNLSTKEIATLMNISVRGVEASRYRLRKRLELQSGTKLGEFLRGI